MTSLPEATSRDLHERLRKAQDAFAARYPGEPASRQPVHTVYGGAHLFKSDTVKKLGEIALRSLAEHASEANVFAEAIGIRAGTAPTPRRTGTRSRRRRRPPRASSRERSRPSSGSASRPSLRRWGREPFAPWTST